MEKQANTTDMLAGLVESAVREWVESQGDGWKLGPWQPSGNITDHEEKQQFRDLQAEVIRQAAGGDKTPTKVLRGFYTMLGKPWTPGMDEQAAQFEKGFDKVAPHLMRWSPTWWDEMHGGKGSVASLANAIAETHRHQGMTSEEAVEMAEEIFEEMYSDPMNHRGFSGKELGDIYRESAKRGYVGRGAGAGKVVAELAPITGVVSAVRDRMGRDGYDTNDIAGMFGAVDRILPSYEGLPWQDVETHIRTTSDLAQQGGMMAATLRDTGQSVRGSGMDLASLEAQNAQLTRQAGGSPVMNMMSATRRAREAGLIQPGSAADQYLESEGREGTFRNAGQWAGMMERSGVGKGSALALLQQRAANSQFVTPELQMGLRQNQAAYDHTPYFDRIGQQYQGNAPVHQELRRGAKNEFVMSRGFKNMQHYDLLHGPAASQLGKTWDDAKNRANIGKSMSHMGWRGPVARTVDALKGPNPTAGGVGLSFIGGYKTAAAGIPDREDYGDPGQFNKDELIDLIIQRHKARRAGEHFDYRIGTPASGLLSWSMKPTQLPKPGEKRFVRQQPVHTHDWGKFQGTIGTGYGKGEVRREQKGKIMITQASPTKIEFTTASTGHPERFVLLKPEKWGARDWLLINNTPNKAVPAEKIRHKKIPAEQVEPYIEQMQEGTSVQAKLDGASSLVKLMRSGAEVLSYRASKSGQPIVHTERFFGGRPKDMQIPKELEGTILRGELYGQRQGLDDGQGGVSVLARGNDPAAGRSGDAGDGAGSVHTRDAAGPVRSGRGGTGTVIPPQQLGGILNATIEHSRQKQQEGGIDLKNMIFDIQQRGKKSVDPEQTPYAERRKMMEEIMQHLPADKFQLSEQATNAEDAKQLWRDILERKHPLTREGVVIHPPTGKPIKAKPLEDSDVHITDIFPGAGRLQGTGAGGFGYSLESGGDRVGEVGTGLTDELRRQMWSDPQAYVGRVARIHSQEQYPSGAWRAPAMIAMHEDKPTYGELNR